MKLGSPSEPLMSDPCGYTRSGPRFGLALLLAVSAKYDMASRRCAFLVVHAPIFRRRVSALVTQLKRSGMRPGGYELAP